MHCSQRKIRKYYKKIRKDLRDAVVSYLSYNFDTYKIMMKFLLLSLFFVCVCGQDDCKYKNIIMEQSLTENNHT